jgi:hypothetical protein
MTPGPQVSYSPRDAFSFGSFDLIAKAWLVMLDSDDRIPPPSDSLRQQ